VILRADERTVLRSPTPADAAPIFALVDSQRAHLRRWLGWVDAVRERAQIEAFLAGVLERERAGTSLELVIEHRGAHAGICGFRSIDAANRAAEIGYWLSAELQGAGVMTRACRALVTHGFETLGLNRIALAAAVENAKSRAVAERLGFRLEGVQRDAEWLYDHFVDGALYSLLRRDTMPP
jgi:ribosomal-protein-serine acetyltransferase